MNKQINHQPNTRQRWLISRLFSRNVALLSLTSILINPIAASYAQSSPIQNTNTDSYIIAQTNSNDYLNLGIERLNQEDYQGAIEKFNQALKLDPKNALAYFCRSIAYSGLGDYQNAINDYESIGKLEAQFAEQIASKKEPTYETAIVKQRRTAIINNIPLVFNVEDNPQASGNVPLYEIPALSWVPSTESPIIDAAAQKYNVDPDLIKAIIWVETTHGYYDYLFQEVGRNSTILPMNVSLLWKEMLGDRQQLMDIQTNVFAGTRLISEIWKRVENPTVEKVATLYQKLSASEVSDYGAWVARAYKDKPWTNPVANPVRMGIWTTLEGLFIRHPSVAQIRAREGRLALSQKISTPTQTQLIHYIDANSNIFVDIRDADPRGVLSSSNLNPKVKAMIVEVVYKLQAEGYHPYIFEGFRTLERQSQIPSENTGAAAGRSWHNYGLAVDIAFWNDQNTGPSWAESLPWGRLGALGKEAGFTQWGGDWTKRDRVHLEYHPQNPRPSLAPENWINLYLKDPDHPDLVSAWASVGIPTTPGEVWLAVSMRQEITENSSEREDFEQELAQSRLKALEDYNPDGLPPPPPPGAATLPRNISEAIAKGEIEVEAEGTGNPSSLRLRINNKNPDRWMQIGIPPGTTFNPGTLNTQNMMIR
jgi:tetratricopeptide (TPR) repeat protein